MTDQPATDERRALEREDPIALAASFFDVCISYDEYASQMRRALSINAHERLALGLLWARGSMSMTELGNRIPLSRAAVTTLVDRLEADGLVRRRADIRDRRRITVEFTQAGITRMLPVAQDWIDEMHAFANGFDAEEWGVIARFLQGFRERNDAQAARLAQLADEEIQALASA